MKQTLFIISLLSAIFQTALSMNSEIELAAKEMRALNQIFIVQSKLDEIQKFIDDTIGGEKTIPLQDFERKNAELNVFWNSIVEEKEKCGNLVSEFNEFLIKNYRSAEKIEQLSRLTQEGMSKILKKSENVLKSLSIPFISIGLKRKTIFLTE